MIRKFIVLVFIIIALTILLVCSFNKPTEIDGSVTARFVVIDTSKTIASDSTGINPVVPHARIRMNSIAYATPLTYETDENGIFEIQNELAGRYRISSDKMLSAEYMLSIGKKAIDVMLSGSVELDLFQSQNERVDTVKVGATFLSSIVINEIYYACPPNSGTYFSDQFIELYNASDSIQYLDQLLIGRLASEQEYPNSIKVIRYYRFPGNGTDHPIAPGQLVVLAMDAIDHVNVGGARGSIDLSNADWEFYNQLYSDLDNPNVPNLTNASPDAGGWDFMISLASDEVCLLRADDLNAVPFYEDGNRLFDLSHIVDGVEYSADADHFKALDTRIDAGLAGYSIQSYSGKSIERHHPETGEPGYDTNNSTFDFVSLYHPTPGWQHSEEDIIPQ